MNNGRGEIPWGLIVMLLIVCFPAGMVLLILKFMLPVLDQLTDGGRSSQKKISAKKVYELKEQIDVSSDKTTYSFERTSGSKPNVVVHKGKVNEGSSGQYSFSREQLAQQNPRSYINDPLDSVQSYSTKTSVQPIKTEKPSQVQNKPATAEQIKKLIPTAGSTALQVLGTIFGSIGFTLATIFGIVSFLAPDEPGFLIAAIVLAIVPGLPGLGMLLTGFKNRNQAKRFRRYYELISDKKQISIDRLAEVMDVSYSTALIDLQKMIDKGLLKNAYIDKIERTYNVGNPFDAIREKEKKELERIEQEKIPDAAKRIREINDDIDDVEVSKKLDKLELITRRIFEYVEKNPELMSKLRNFTGYYLPTTLKILEAYARFEEQEVQGKNVSAAMQDIEELLDTLIRSFESQLDQLYDDETLDVSTDITVLENMLEREGLTGNGFKIEPDIKTPY